MTTDTADRVERGADLLDDAFPGWEDYIDVDRLDIGSLSDCVLAQLYGSYHAGVDALGVTTTGRSAVTVVHDLGFAEDIGHRHHHLTAAWRDYLS